MALKALEASDAYVASVTPDASDAAIKTTQKTRVYINKNLLHIIIYTLAFWAVFSEASEA